MHDVLIYISIILGWGRTHVGMDPKDLNTRETEYKTGSNEIHYIGTLTRDDGSNVRSGSEN